MNNDVSVFINIIYTENATYPLLLHAGVATAGDLCLVKSKDNPGGSLWTHGSEFKFTDPDLIDLIAKLVNEELIKPDENGNINLLGNLILDNSNEEKDNDTYVKTYKVIANLFNIIGNDGNEKNVFHFAEDDKQDIILVSDTSVILQIDDIALGSGDNAIDVSETLKTITNSLLQINNSLEYNCID